MNYTDIYVFILQERRQHNFQNICSDCQLAIAKQTIDLPPVIKVFGQVGTEFTSYLSPNIITPHKQQEIQNAKNDGEALGIIRQVCLFCNECKMKNTSSTSQIKYC